MNRRTNHSTQFLSLLSLVLFASFFVPVRLVGQAPPVFNPDQIDHRQDGEYPYWLGDKCEPCTAGSGVSDPTSGGTDHGEGTVGMVGMASPETGLEPMGDGGISVSPCLEPVTGPGGLEWDPSPSFSMTYEGQQSQGDGDYFYGHGNNWFPSVPEVEIKPTPRVPPNTDTPLTIRWEADKYRHYDPDSALNATGDPCTGYRRGRLQSDDVIVRTVCVEGCANQGTSCNKSEHYVYDREGKVYEFDKHNRMDRVTHVGGSSIKIGFKNDQRLGFGGQIDVVEQLDDTQTAAFTWEYSKYGPYGISTITLKDGSGTRLREVAFTYGDKTGTYPEAREGDMVGIVDRWFDENDNEQSRKTWVYKYWMFAWDSNRQGNPGQIRATIGPGTVAEWERTHSGNICGFRKV